jgi:predicted secreted protein
MPALVITDEATVAEIDEALGYARQMPAADRGAAWHAFVDRLLEMRAAKNTGATLTAAFNNGQQ